MEEELNKKDKALVIIQKMVAESVVKEFQVICYLIYCTTADVTTYRIITELGLATRIDFRFKPK